MHIKGLFAIRITMHNSVWFTTTPSPRTHNAILSPVANHHHHCDCAGKGAPRPHLEKPRSHMLEPLHDHKGGSTSHPAGCTTSFTPLDKGSFLLSKGRRWWNAACKQGNGGKQANFHNHGRVRAGWVLALPRVAEIHLPLWWQQLDVDSVWRKNAGGGRQGMGKGKAEQNYKHLLKPATSYSWLTSWEDRSGRLRAPVGEKQLEENKAYEIVSCCHPRIASLTRGTTITNHNNKHQV